MRKKAARIATLAVILIAGTAACKSTFAPQIQTGSLVLDGSMTHSMTTYGCPEFLGNVKNSGNKTVYNAKIEVTCYSDTGKRNIIDIASAFPASLGDIKPGQRASFGAVAFKLKSWDEIKAYEHRITWLDR